MPAWRASRCAARAMPPAASGTPRTASCGRMRTSGDVAVDDGDTGVAQAKRQSRSVWSTTSEARLRRRRVRGGRGLRASRICGRRGSWWPSRRWYGVGRLRRTHGRTPVPHASCLFAGSDRIAGILFAYAKPHPDPLRRAERRTEDSGPLAIRGMCLDMGMGGVLSPRAGKLAPQCGQANGAEAPLFQQGAVPRSAAPGSDLAVILAGGSSQSPGRSVRRSAYSRRGFFLARELWGRRCVALTRPSATLSHWGRGTGWRVGVVNRSVCSWIRDYDRYYEDTQHRRCAGARACWRAAGGG
jgi:hypothetical protein